jgi:hypothetical protein
MYLHYIRSYLASYPEDTGGDGAEYDPDETTDLKDRIGTKYFFQHDIKNNFKYHLVTMIKTVTVSETYTTYATTTACTKTFLIR